MGANGRAVAATAGTSTASGTAFSDDIVAGIVTGVFEAMLETLAAVVERDTTADMIDSTVVRAHHCAVGLKKGIRRPRGSAVREVAFTTQAARPLRRPGSTAMLRPDTGTGSPT